MCRDGKFSLMTSNIPSRNRTLQKKKERSRTLQSTSLPCHDVVLGISLTPRLLLTFLWNVSFLLFTKKPNIWCRNPGGDRAPATARRLSPPPSDWDSALFLCWGHWTPCGKCSLVSDPPPGRPVLIAAASGQTLLRHLVAPRFRGVKETSSLHGNHFCKQQLNSRWRGRPPPSLELIREGAMGTSQSKFDSKTPLGCLLANLRTLELDQDLRRRRLIHYCTVAWPQYRLNNQSQWPPEGTFDYQILTDLDNLCRRQGKWSEVPYVQAFWTLRSRPELCSSCSTSQVLLACSPPRTLPHSTSRDSNLAPLSPLAEPPEDLSRPPVRAPHLSPPPYQPAPQQSVSPTLPQSPKLQPRRSLEHTLSNCSSPPSPRTSTTFQPPPFPSYLCPYQIQKLFPGPGPPYRRHMPVGAQAVPAIEPGWSYQDGQDGRRRRDHMVRCLIAGMRAASNKAVNYDKIRDIIQAPDENPAIFLNRLTEALIQYTRLDPASPDIRKKLKKVEEGPQTPISDLVRMAFKVFNSREEAAELKRQARLQQKIQLQTQALVAALRPAGSRSQQKGGTNRTPPGPASNAGLKAIGPVSAPTRGHQLGRALSAV
ncbi:unnamed protein product [Nyctereutes procyonoides]|uniref:(raccoon dog) hypothetical protein n=1 Tax=Nyctereutes procyonoides TaxID=34880 RepID=A0A811XZY2_NYCPR|nr:unnamed protein product [Nyctereutes procyonoides]